MPIKCLVLQTKSLRSSEEQLVRRFVEEHLHSNCSFVVVVVKEEDAEVEWLTVLSHMLNNRISIGCLVHVGLSN